MQRDDDKEATVRNRLDIYHAQTKPLVEYYTAWSASGEAAAPKVKVISGMGSVDDITARVFDALG